MQEIAVRVLRVAAVLVLLAAASALVLVAAAAILIIRILLLGLAPQQVEDQCRRREGRGVRRWEVDV